MTHLLWVILLFPSSILSTIIDDPPADLKYVDLIEKDDYYECGISQIRTGLEYCTHFKTCDKVGIVKSAADTKLMKPTQTLAYCDPAIKNVRAQIRISETPDIWKNLHYIMCQEKDGKNAALVKFAGKDLEFASPDNQTKIALRCVGEGRARFDIYHRKEEKDPNEGVYENGRYFVVYTFVALMSTLTLMALYYLLYLCLENKKLEKTVAKRQNRHDELWLSIERAQRTEYDAEEVWDAMPLIHQQVALEAAIFIQRYKGEKFTPQLRQWLIDRNYPAGATEIILYIAGLNDPEIPFYAPEERSAASGYKNEHRIEQFSERIESRIVDTLNYANRLIRRKIVFTDHRWLELHHLLIELGLTSLGSPSHPTIHDADIPILPRHAFGTRDNPRDEEKEEKENEMRMRRPHFLHHDWDEAQKLLG